VTGRPYVLLSVATSVDGCIDDASDDRVDAERAGVDAILVGATTIRRDDPRLLVRSPERIAARVAAGRTAHPMKLTISSSGDLDPSARFFTAGQAERIVYVPASSVGPVQARLGSVATVVGAGDPVDPRQILADLGRRGVRRLMVEGGTAVHTLFLTAGLVDELHLVVAPFFVGDADAPRFVAAGAFPHDVRHRMRLAELRMVDDVALLRFLLDGSDDGSA
jgi:5-amino-6-(5-phosphoribosylamino)uracil reductase